jgi:putative membrane protein
MVSHCIRRSARFLQAIADMNMNLLTVFALLGLSLNPQVAPADSTMHLDQHTLSRIHQINQMEIKAAKLALKKSNSADVQSFANRIIRDHTDADQMVKEVAQKDHIELVSPPVPASAQERKDAVANRSAMRNLATLSDGAFETTYKKMMEDGHQKAIAYLSEVELKVKTKNIQDLIQKLLPNFQHHEALAQQLPSGSSVTRTG